MDKDKIAGKIEALQKDAQARLNELAHADGVWQNLQGQIGVWNEVLGNLKEEPGKVGK